MRIKITSGGIYGAEGELPVGTELDVSAVPSGWAGRYVDLDAETQVQDRDDEGDTPVMAAMRARFDAAYKLRGDELAEANKSITALTAKVAEQEAEIADLKAKLAASGASNSATTNPLDHDGDCKSGGAKPNDPPSERGELKKQADELGLEYARNISTEKLKELIDAKLAA